MQRDVDHLLVEVLGLAMKTTQILMENHSSFFQCNIVPRKANLVPDYLPKELTDGIRLYISHGTVWALLELLCAVF